MNMDEVKKIIEDAFNRAKAERGQKIAKEEKEKEEKND